MNNRDIKLTLVEDLGSKILNDGRPYRIGLFKCSICESTVEKIMKDGIKAKVCSHACYSKIRGRRGQYKDGPIMISGYYYEYAPDHPDALKKGYVAQHRLVAEKMLGRRLSIQEDVHHINEIKTDNRPENLIVLSKSDHIKLHREQSKRHSNGQFKV